MNISERHLENHRLETIIEHGFALAEAEGKSGLQDAIWYLLVEACDTLKALPGERNLGFSSTASWPVDISIDWKEWFSMEIERLQDNVDPGAVNQMRRRITDPRAIDRAEIVMTWYRMIDTRNRRRDQRILFLSAWGLPAHKVRADSMRNRGDRSFRDARQRARIVAETRQPTTCRKYFFAYLKKHL